MRREHLPKRGPTMAGNIFISYRRDDEGHGIAHGIQQYLEREFGSGKVFIDVDMHAGAKFKNVLELRLAESKVLLALIGPRWLDARDDVGNRRLDDPNDWVRLEIAQALKRDIAVIPVCIEGADLPKKSALPGDIQGLVDHQAVTVTTTGFRNEMKGLASDIRRSSSRWPFKNAAVPWGAGVVIAAAAVAVVYWSLVGNFLRYTTGPPDHQEKPATLSSPKVSQSEIAVGREIVNAPPGGIAVGGNIVNAPVINGLDETARAAILAGISGTKLLHGEYDSALRLAALGTRLDLTVLPLDAVKSSRAVIALTGAVQQYVAARENIWMPLSTTSATDLLVEACVRLAGGDKTDARRNAPRQLSR
jgi:TIR domain